jgi:hypothetical protein
MNKKEQNSKELCLALDVSIHDRPAGHWPSTTHSYNTLPHAIVVKPHHQKVG